MKTRYLVPAIAVATAATAQAAFMDGDEQGIKLLDNRLTLSPYVSMSYTYDSNIDSSKHSKSGSQWNVNPGINMKYDGELWGIDANVFYTYHAYNRYTSQLNSSSYGENVKFRWSNALGGGTGSTINFTQSFRQIAQDDDMTNDKGRGIGRDRRQFSFGGGIDHRINNYMHGGLDIDYYFLDYDNNVDKYATMYGWKRMNLGGTLGCTLTKWTDLLVSASYQWYEQDNDRESTGHSSDASTSRRRPDSESKGWTVMAGLGTHATEKLRYRIMTGWSHFEYGGGVYDTDGWTYQLAGDWQIDAENTWHAMVIGSSYYQPSETSYSAASKVYTLSGGIAKGLVKNQLRATFDLSYRKETQEYSAYREDDYDQDVITARAGLSYKFNRLLSVYGTVEYQTDMASGDGVNGHEYDYDRWRGTLGLRLTY